MFCNEMSKTQCGFDFVMKCRDTQSKSETETESENESKSERVSSCSPVDILQLVHGIQCQYDLSDVEPSHVLIEDVIKLGKHGH